ncbi:UNVERIFIED_CONTAM: hypothetical protein PYX00_009146 [Menopon gallinae]|uniref:Uncharacterized protein n=1 Tax=Menopon gallinae TaxID=328185 RepID=A0AAW2HA10_9NEOP
MRFFKTQVLFLCVTLIRGGSSSFEPDFTQYLDNIFLNPDVTLEDAKIVLWNARECYGRLKDYEAEKDPKLLDQIRKILSVFEIRTIRDVTQEGMNLTQLFENINSYIPG